MKLTLGYASEVTQRTTIEAIDYAVETVEWRRKFRFWHGVRPFESSEVK